jgi:two-component system, NarL family, nitrate/nitrite response regulator NarL
MATDRTFELSKPLIDIEADATLAAPRAAKAQAILVIATRHEITAAGIETVLQAAGHRVVARCWHEDDLLGSLEAYRPDIIMLSENIVGWEAARTVLRLRARNCSVAIIFVLEKRDAITAADLLDLDADGILSSGTCARSFIDCVNSVHQGRKWIDPHLLHQLAIADRSPQIMSSLTSREADVAHLVLRGWHNKQIARELHLSEGTVKMHLHHIYEKLRLGGRTQLALSMAAVCAEDIGH